MNILVLNGSPKGDYSITLQTLKYIEKFNNKKGIALCIIFPTVATLIVALSRIVVGAHYMSDVLVGGTMTLVSSIFALKITNLIFKKAQKNG